MITIQDRTATLTIKEFTPETYKEFLKAKALPRYQVDYSLGAWNFTFPVEYIEKFGQNYDCHVEKIPLPFPDCLFDRQEVAIKVCWMKKHYALFWDAGDGKTLVFLELARQLSSLGKKCLIVSPLNVIHQTIEASMEFYDEYPHIINLHSKKNSLEEFVKDDTYNIAIVNHMWFRQPRDMSGIDAIFLDESSILKQAHGVLRTNMVESTKGMEYKFCFSATPAPNARQEYAQHAVFLEVVRSDTEFQAMFFVAKDMGYVLRHHCKRKFYDFLSSWSMFMRHPELYGFKDTIDLPPYYEHQERIDITQEQIDLINREMNRKQTSLVGIPTNPNGFRERQIYNQVSKGFIYHGKNSHRTIEYVPTHKSKAIVDYLLQYPDEKAIVWCVYDEEGEIVQRYIKEHTSLSTCHLTGKTPLDKREKLIEDFRHRKIDVMITKPKLLGLGLNLHVASVCIFSGLQDSAEQYYQALKRCWRYPQETDVKVYLPYTDYEKAILDNVLGKRAQMESDFELQEKMYVESGFNEIKEYLETDVMPMKRKIKMLHGPVITEEYELYHTDSISATLDGLAENSAHLIITSPPFPGDIFAYTDSVSDMGNTGGAGASALPEYNAHMLFWLKGMYKTLKAGRLLCLEISQIPLRKGLDGYIGMRDVCGSIIDLACKAGFFQFGEWAVLGNPQAEAIVKHISTLNMGHIRGDRSKLAPMINDYILIFKKPGVNEVPITNQIEYRPLEDLLPFDNSITSNDDAVELWHMFRENPAKNEWFVLEIDNEIQVRRPGILNYLNQMKKNEQEPPIYVRMKNKNWLVPVEVADLTNEEWIESAEGIAQGKRFNRKSTMHNSTKQAARYDDYISRVEQEYDNAKEFFENINKKIESGELSKREAMMIFSGALVDIDQTNTLNTPYTRGRTKKLEDADKHACPFSLDLVDLLIRMYSNKGETVFDPFGGVGSTPMMALRRERKAIAMELKPEYFLQMAEICEQEVDRPLQLKMF